MSDTVLYARYSRERRPELQIETRILRRGGEVRVEKRALVPEAIPHVALIAENHRSLARSFSPVKVPQALAGTPEGVVAFPYVVGTSLDALAFRALERHDREGVLSVVETYVSLLAPEASSGPPAEGPIPWPELEDRRLIPCGNLDASLDNILRDRDGSYWAIDGEWVLAGPAPAPFVLVRCLDLFLSRHGRRLEGLVTEEELLHVLGVPAVDVATVRALEPAFQDWVFGRDRSHAIPAAALKPVRPLADVLADVSRLAGELNALAEARDREHRTMEEAISRLQDEVERLTASLRVTAEAHARAAARASELQRDKDGLLDGLQGLSREVQRRQKPARAEEPPRAALQPAADLAADQVAKLERALQERDQRMADIQKTLAWRILSELGLDVTRR